VTTDGARISTIAMRERAALRDGRSGNNEMSDGSCGQTTNVQFVGWVEPFAKPINLRLPMGFAADRTSVRSAALPILQMIGFMESIV
jgi:hypothetical protein